MKVVYLAEELCTGGMSTYVLKLARMAQAYCSSVTIALIKGVTGTRLETEGVDIVTVSSASDLRALSPDIVHVHLLSDIDFLKELFTLDVPLVRFYHDYTSTCLRRGKRRWPGDRCQRALGVSCAAYGCVIGPPLAPGQPVRLMNLPEKIAEKNMYRQFDASIVGSNYMASMLLKNGFDPNRVHMIPYFSSYADQASSPVLKPLQEGRPLELLFSGQAVKGKGLEILIDALAGLDGAWRLSVFSEGPCLDSAREKAEQHGIAGNISFHGWITQSALADAYRAADVFVLPSIWDDPGPLVGIEAMTFGTPVIGFAVGGIPDYVVDGQTGWLVKDISVAGFHRTLQDALRNRACLPVMAAEAQKLVTARHSSESHSQQVEAIYKNLFSQSQQKELRAKRGAN